jgi:hypothetical protein
MREHGFRLPYHPLQVSRRWTSSSSSSLVFCFFFGCDRSEFISPDLVLALTSHRSSCFHFSIDQ